MLTMKNLMTNFSLRQWTPQLIAVLLFSAAALGFYYPVLSGKTMLQSDIQQYEGMARQLKEHREATGEELYWIDNAFGGMPTYQLGVKYPLDILAPVYQLTRIFPRPAHLLFLYLLCTYCLLLVLQLPWRTALIGAAGFGFSTYLLIILQVGHNTKAEAIAYMPLVLAGWFLIFQGKKGWGWLLSVLALGMQIRANHYQMTYYLLFLLGCFVVVYAIAAYRQKQLLKFMKQLALFASAGVLALGLNATPLLATAEYSSYSTRGPSPLKMTVEGTPKTTVSGLDFEYITQYSYGIFESLSLLVPRVQGGGSREAVGTTSDLYQFLVRQGVPAPQAANFVEAVPLYWGDQPILEAPAYIGVSIVFLAFIALFTLKGRKRNALLAAIVVSLLLSWGKNVAGFTAFMIDYFPLYDKFRAVSSAQVILELCFPVLAVLGVNQWTKTAPITTAQWLRYSAYFIGGLVFLLLSKSALSFRGPMDGYLQEAYGPELFELILQTRKEVFSTDVLRAIGISLVLSGLGGALLAKKLKPTQFSLVVLAVVLFDLLSVGERYIHRDQFPSLRVVQQQWRPTNANATILQDTTRYRVYEPSLRLSGARTAYFHNAIGGYHGAKLGRFQEAYDYFVSQQWSGFLNMLNTKYVIYEEDDGVARALINPEAFGPVWLVDRIVPAEDADALLQNLKTLALPEEVIVLQKDAARISPLPAQRDTLARMELKSAHPQRLVYDFESVTAQFAVFSEIYYPKGWQASIDGKPVAHYPVNHILRGLPLEKGKHEVVFEFRPSFLTLGTTLRGGAALLLILVFAGVVRKEFKNS